MVDKAKHVLFVAKAYTFSGAEKRLLSWMQEVDFNKVKITVLIADPASFPEFVRRQYSRIKFEVFNYEEIKSFRDWFKLLNQYRPHSVVFVQTWFEDFPFFAVLAGWLISRNHVFISEHTDLPKPKETRKRWFGLVQGRALWKLPWTMRAHLSRAVITTSESLKQKMCQYYNYPPEKIFVSYIAIDFERFKPNPQAKSIRSQCGIPKEDMIIINISRLAWDKAVDKTIAAFAETIKVTGRDDLWLWLIGDGPEKERLQQMAKEKGVENRVTFWGYQEKIEEWLWESDIFVLSSSIESFGSVLLEAAGVGLPCLATATGGAKEILTEPGFISDHDERSLAQALQNLVSFDRNSLGRLGMETRDQILRRFNSRTGSISALKLLSIPLKIGET